MRVNIFFNLANVQDLCCSGGRGRGLERKGGLNFMLPVPYTCYTPGFHLVVPASIFFVLFLLQNIM